MTADYTGTMLDLKDSNGLISVIQAGESCRIVAQLMEDDTDIEKTALVTLTLTLYDEATGAILNSRSNQNILDANGGTVSADGELTLIIAAADNAVIGDAAVGEVEKHVARITWTWTVGGVTLTGKQELRFAVQEIRVPS